MDFLIDIVFPLFSHVLQQVSKWIANNTWHWSQGLYSGISIKNIIKKYANNTSSNSQYKTLLKSHKPRIKKYNTFQHKTQESRPQTQ